MKKQLNIRTSDATRSKIRELQLRYGTQAEVVAVAVDRLYQAEIVASDKRNSHRKIKV